MPKNGIIIISVIEETIKKNQEGGFVIYVMVAEITY